MFFRQFIDPDLGCASYILGDQGTAVVVDPGIDVQRYVDAALEHDARIDLVVETHIHADHVSGRALLADQVGAAIRLPAGAGADTAASGADLIAGEQVAIGRLELTVLASPGHRPEHIAFAVTDTARCPDPCMLLTGDSLLVGDVARPDLAVDARDGARDLHATIARLGALGDALELWPGHIGGSLCGGAALSPRPSSTVGYERRANDLLSVADPAVFADRVIASIPARPPTVERVVSRNRSARPATPVPRANLDAGAVRHALEAGAVLIDGRPAAEFDAAHVPGSINLPLTGRGLGTRAGWVLDPGVPLIVCANGEDGTVALARRLRAVALDHVVGLLPEGASSLRDTGLELVDGRPLGVGELARRLPSLTLVDVRGEGEWRAGHVAGSIHLPLESLRSAASALPAARLAVACAVGNRAAFATSWLRRLGLDVRRLAGGGVPDLAAHGVALVRA